MLDLLLLVALASVLFWALARVGTEVRQGAIARHGESALTRYGATAAVSGSLLVLAVVYVRTILSQLPKPRELDFMCFWTWGRMGVLGLDFYDPASGNAFRATSSPSFIHEVLDVGCWYPPQTMLLMAPLGWLRPESAIVPWYAVQLAAAAGCALLARRIFLPSTGTLGLGALLGLLLVMPGARATAWLAQTNFLCLLLTLLVWRAPGAWPSGVWAALALVVKPYLAIWIVALALFRSWRAFATALITFAALTGLSAALFGADRIVTFIVDNPGARVPATSFSESVNQSFFAAFLRVMDATHRAHSAEVRGAAFAALAVFLLPAGWALIKLGRREPLLSASILLVATLIAYPGTLAHYSVLTAAPIFLLWSLYPGLRTATLALVVLVLARVASGELTFLAHTVLLGWLVVVAFVRRRDAAAPHTSDAEGMDRPS